MTASALENSALHLFPAVWADHKFPPFILSRNRRASGSGKRRRMYPRPPRANGHPKGSAFPSLTAARGSQPSPAGGRRSARALTDPPKRFFSLDRARPVSLLARPKEKWGVHCPAIIIAVIPRPMGRTPARPRPGQRINTSGRPSHGPGDPCKRRRSQPARTPPCRPRATRSRSRRSWSWAAP